MGTTCSETEFYENVHYCTVNKGSCLDEMTSNGITFYSFQACKEKHGKLLAGFGKMITHPKDIVQIKFDKILICSYFFKKEIINSLKKYVDNKKKILTI